MKQAPVAAPICASPGGNQLDRMIAWEEGELDFRETVALFQELLDSGTVWHLQGCYGRMAQSLLEAGLIGIHH